MGWAMQATQHYDEVQTRWHAPPPVEEGQRAHVDAPTAADLLVAYTPDAPAAH
ncbi:MAG: hypothetical protein H0V52_09230 [Acidimicrobiia bacterium]|jgi:hypothetical protein|nr:hypothetical protein [Acidimicrobiia bacterium]